MSGIGGVCKFQPASGNREDWGRSGGAVILQVLVLMNRGWPQLEVMEQVCVGC